MSHDLPSLSTVLIENSHAVKSFDDMKKLINDYNKWIEENNCLIQEYKQSTSYKQSSNDLVNYQLPNATCLIFEISLSGNATKVIEIKSPVSIKNCLNYKYGNSFRHLKFSLKNQNPFY